MFGIGKQSNTTTPAVTSGAGTPLLRIGIFYDGSFLHHVSSYYKFVHERRQRLSMPGLQEFIRAKAAEFEGVDRRHARIVASHYFRGRFPAPLSQANDKLYSERLFDDVLIGEGIQMHYMPVSGNREMGIDVALALECFDESSRGIFDVVALVAGDGDFAPLAQRLSRMGVRVMVVGWTFEYTDAQNGGLHQTTTSMRLISEATYPIAMHEAMNAPVDTPDPLLRQLFVEGAQQASEAGRRPDGSYTGVVCSLKDGFGFINCDAYPNNIFFHYTALVDGKFSDLAEGDNVVFKVENGERGELATNVKKL